jgi:Ca2+-binding RTX toxin-like protein
VVACWHNSQDVVDTLADRPAGGSRPGRTNIATVTLYVATDFVEALSEPLGGADVLSFSASQIRFGMPGGPTLLLLSGQFNFTPDGYLNYGTLTGFTSYRPNGAGKSMEVTGMRVDMDALFDIPETATEDQIGEFLFGGADRFTGSTSDDELRSYGGNDKLDGGAGNDTLDGGAGNDTILGGAGEDWIEGGAGNDSMDGGEGPSSTLVGGSGSDLYIVRDRTEIIETDPAASGGVDLVLAYLRSFGLASNVENGRLMLSTGGTLDGNALGNQLMGGVGADTLSGKDGNDGLQGGDGNDVLYGDAGVDTMTGGAGIDVYYVSETNDVVVESGSGGFDIVLSSVTFTLPSNVERLTLVFGPANGTGNGLANEIYGSDAANILDGLGGNDYLNGQPGADTLRGGDGNDLLDGGVDRDTLIGGAGNDVYDFWTGVDIVVESSGGGIDTILCFESFTLPSEVEVLSFATTTTAVDGTGNNLSNTITGGEAGNRLTGLGGNDSLLGMNGNDTLEGGNGNDMLDGGAGNDALIGGNGADTYHLRNAADTVSETDASSAGGVDTVLSYLSSHTLGANIENGRVMSSGTASLTGNGLGNLLVAGAGNNALNGGGGVDTVSYALAGAAVTLSLAVSTGQATGGSGTDTLTSIEGLIGSGHDDQLIGSSAANHLSGGGGKDRLDGGSGNDTMVGGDGSDLYRVRDVGDVVIETNASPSSGGYDTVYSYLATLTLGSHVENGRIVSSGTASLTGNELNNLLYAGSGNNVISGGSGIDTVSYSTAGAAVKVSLAVTTGQVTGGSGTDTLAGLENLTGSAFNDTLNGSTGANVLQGGDGNDLLNGGSGNDVLSGGSGADVFRFTSTPSGAVNIDTLSDFSGVDDSIQLENSAFTKLATTGVLSSSNFRAHASGDAGDSNDFVLYETDTGKLFYDADGNGAGAKVQIALLANAPALSHLDIFVT